MKWQFVFYPICERYQDYEGISENTDAWFVVNKPSFSFVHSKSEKWKQSSYSCMFKWILTIGYVQIRSWYTDGQSIKRFQEKFKKEDL